MYVVKIVMHSKPTRYLADGKGAAKLSTSFLDALIFAEESVAAVTAACVLNKAIETDNEELKDLSRATIVDWDAPL